MYLFENKKNLHFSIKFKQLCPIEVLQSVIYPSAFVNKIIHKGYKVQKLLTSVESGSSWRPEDDSNV